MYSVEIDNPKQIEDYGIPTCIISITENHPLHNKNRKENEFMKELNFKIHTFIFHKITGILLFR